MTAALAAPALAAFDEQPRQHELLNGRVVQLLRQLSALALFDAGQLETELLQAMIRLPQALGTLGQRLLRLT
jgi:hypothetical protein